MSDNENIQATPDRELIESVWAEARDLIKRLEGSTVQRFAVAAGDYKIEIERGAPPVAPGVPGAPPPPPLGGLGNPSGPVATGAGPGMSIAPGARMASGVFMIGDLEADKRVPVLAPLVGTYYSAAQPGAKPFVEVGSSVEPGETVCIVEAMKMMNEVSAGEGGKVAEIVVENGEWVEFEQVLMYLEPADD
ncbi:MAG TPA: biotin/lipoyl-containing protein [Solirubrobacteraceae bacterium]|jgi:acetyl-CoA carboxylase biotin carboxyl carrier protein|nr:biotin/lipoyl-containing protein [Solirubrobacteraceae bacterium]